MKKILYSIFALLTIINLISCDEENNDPVLTGNWKYSKPFFEFEYATDSVTIEMYGDKKISLDVDDIKTMVMGMATEKMGSYFEGIEFEENNQLKIKAKMKSDATFSIRADYSVKKDQLVVNLNKEDMRNLLGDKAAMIPAISMKVDQKGENMTLYLDQAYIRTVYAAMENQIIPMIIQMMGIDFSQHPELESELPGKIRTQISQVFDHIIQLKLGFELKKIN